MSLGIGPVSHVIDALCLFVFPSVVIAHSPSQWFFLLLALTTSGLRLFSSAVYAEEMEALFLSFSSLDNLSRINFNSMDEDINRQSFHGTYVVQDGLPLWVMMQWMENSIARLTGHMRMNNRLNRVHVMKALTSPFFDIGKKVAERSWHIICCLFCSVLDHLHPVSAHILSVPAALSFYRVLQRPMIYTSYLLLSTFVSCQSSRSSRLSMYMGFPCVSILSSQCDRHDCEIVTGWSSSSELRA